MAGSKLDVITLWHVLEHVTDLKSTLQFFSDNLSDKGRLIIAVPNYTSFDADIYKEFWAGYDVPRHIYHFEINTITKLLAQFGFAHERSLPMKFDSTYVSMLSEKYNAGSIKYPKAFINGLRSNLKAKERQRLFQRYLYFQKGISLNLSILLFHVKQFCFRFNLYCINLCQAYLKAL